MTTRPIEKLLVANRGEIARRIFRTCRDLGIATVAVFSDADADAPFVREADEAVRLGPAPSRESYLKVPAILRAADVTGADAIHPGYGFLAENAEFAEAVIAAGLRFVGPTPAAIRAMGSKREAKALVAEAGVPVIPGYDGADQDPAVLAREAEAMGFPVLLKASAGGGGKGMKRVDRAEDVLAAIASAKREALGAFGDDVLLVEKYVERPRHVEIQIFGDTHGRVVHLYERECSLQRRHQKVIEEAPSPALVRDPALRARMGAAAVKVGKTIGYVGAGTVELILGEDGSFYFLEVNTRLQVEHPVTEEVTGLDLVREQIRVAEGHPLSLLPVEGEEAGASPATLGGWALEARLYAEDAAAGFLPQSGVLTGFHLPELAGVRLDTGVEAGSEVSIHYDPMLAKVIARGADREEARRRLVNALRRFSVAGVTTNREFLVRALTHEAFVAGALHTHFIDEHLAGPAPAPERALDRLAAFAAVLVGVRERELARADRPAVPSGYRNQPSMPQGAEMEVDGRALAVLYTHRVREPGTFDVAFEGEEGVALVVRRVAQDAERLVLEAGGHRRTLRVVGHGEGDVHVLTEGRAFAVRERPRFPEPGAQEVAGGCLAPMPGKVVSVAVAAGDAVSAGQTLVVLEAMKMEHTVTAPEDGVAAAVHVQAGDQVDADALLVTVDAGEAADA
ncbi:MAG: biotin carboxylase N-terminal domain-containing protein [Myxococcota bacterium]